jgi:uncharacterized protein (TIGR02996 family)
VYKHVPEQFVAAMRLDHRDLTVRLVMADWLDEHNRSAEAAAWRWSVEERLWPVFVGADYRDVNSKFVGKWNWFGPGWPDAYMDNSKVTPYVPYVHFGDCPLELLDRLVEWYLGLSSIDKARAGRSRT